MLLKLKYWLDIFMPQLFMYELEVLKHYSDEMINCVQTDSIISRNLVRYGDKFHFSCLKSIEAVFKNKKSD